METVTQEAGDLECECYAAARPAGSPLKDARLRDPRPGGEPGPRLAWSPRGRNGKQRGEAAAAFQLGGWRRPGRAPGAARPPRLRPRPPSGSQRRPAGTLPQPGSGRSWEPLCPLPTTAKCPLSRAPAVPTPHPRISSRRTRQLPLRPPTPGPLLQAWRTLGSPGPASCAAPSRGPAGLQPRSAPRRSRTPEQAPSQTGPFGSRVLVVLLVLVLVACTAHQHTLQHTHLTQQCKTHAQHTQPAHTTNRTPEAHARVANKVTHPNNTSQGNATWHTYPYNQQTPNHTKST